MIITAQTLPGMAADPSVWRAALAGVLGAL